MIFGKDMLATGLIGTIAALVLGLLIALANSTYETQSSLQRAMAPLIWVKVALVISSILRV
jgi:ABC-type lipoprotein release transport system permease subunit